MFDNITNWILNFMMMVLHIVGTVVVLLDLAIVWYLYYRNSTKGVRSAPELL
jgi:hypothetical protein